MIGAFSSTSFLLYAISFILKKKKRMPLPSGLKETIVNFGTINQKYRSQFHIVIYKNKKLCQAFTKPLKNNP
jgi:hypothetical protein